MRDQAGRVRRYYNRNTSWMLLFGQGRGEAVIHRPVWTDRDSSRSEALHAVERLIAGALLGGQATRSPARLLDLGCGAGGSALWLAANYPVRITGVTLSPVQVQIARKLALRRGLNQRCTFLAADFSDLPELGGITDAYAVESFSHASSPDAIFGSIGGLLPPGGRLVLCDDFTSAEMKTDSERRTRWLSRFREGWHLQSLITAEELTDVGARYGFGLVEKRDLTPHLRHTPALLRGLQQLAGGMLRKSTLGASMYGGSALQICQANGWTRYLFLVLEKL